MARMSKTTPVEVREVWIAPGVLERARVDKGLSQRQVALQLGVYPAYVAAWENGRGISGEHLAGLLAVLDLVPRYTLDGAA